MREHGAASVLGFDLSQNMIARAKDDTANPAIEHHIADIETLDLTLSLLVGSDSINDSDQQLPLFEE